MNRLVEVEHGSCFSQEPHTHTWPISGRINRTATTTAASRHTDQSSPIQSCKELLVNDTAPVTSTCLSSSTFLQQPEIMRLLLALLAMHVALTGGVFKTEEPQPPKDKKGMGQGPGVEISQEKRLVKDLLARYDVVSRQGRPVLDSTSTVQVQFGLGLIQMDLDEKDKVLTMSMWSRYIWRDQYMVWDPKDYGNVTTVRVGSDLVWIPDVMLYNTAAVDKAIRDSLVVVNYDGTAVWFPHAIFKSSCSVNVSNFPFDEQQCHMWFGSWTYPTKQINLTMAGSGGIDLSTFQADYKEGSAWDVFKVKAERRIMPAETEDPNYSVLTFEIHLRRRRVFSTYILTLPCVFLACLTLVVFLLPPDRPDRTSLAMSLFASFMVLLLILVEAAPPTASSIPTLGIYYCFNLVIIMFSIFLSSVVVHVSRGGTKGYAHPPPKWMEFLILRMLGRVLCVPTEDVVKRSPSATIGSPTLQANNKSVSYTHFGYCIREDCQRIRLTNGSGDKNTCNHEEGRGASFQEEMIRVKRLLLEMRMEIQRLADSEAGQKKNQALWKIVAVVIDRLFFILYLVLIVVNLLTFFPRP